MGQIQHRHIEVFRAVMTAGSVTGAAGLLHTSQPTVSRELARLEYLLGYTLFERNQGRLRATARALALFDEVQRSYQGLNQVLARAEALGRAQHETLNVLSLPALSHALLPGAAARFMAQHEAARLSITPQESPLLEEWMSAQRFDIGLSEQPQAPAGTTHQLLLSLDEVCVLPAGHALLAKPVLALQDFEQQAFVSLAADDRYRLQFDALFSQAGVQRNLRVETHSAVAVCALVTQGLGLAIVNPLTALACASEALQLRRLAVSVPFEVGVLLPQYRPLSGLTQDFVSALRAEAQELSQALDAKLQLRSMRA